MQRITKYVIGMTILMTSIVAWADLDVANPGASNVNGTTNATSQDVISQAPNPEVPAPEQVKRFTPSGGNQQYFCPSGSAYVRTGMSLVEVMDACGQPQGQTKLKENGTDKRPVKQWLYRIAPQVASTGFLQFTEGPPTTMMIYFKDDKVTSIQLSGNNAQSTSLCDGAVNIGDTPNQVQTACGSPAVQNETYENESNGSSNDIEIWVYKPNTYGNTATLRFVNGYLDTIKQ